MRAKPGYIFCQGSLPPSAAPAAAPASTTTTRRPPVLFTVDNCTCVTNKLCHPEDTVNVGQGLIDLRNFCSPGLVCCLRPPDISIQLQSKPVRQSWGWGGGGEGGGGNTGQAWGWQL